ncbi:MAG: hypothetical protein AAF170_01220 [Bacteroidota bacterium]
MRLFCNSLTHATLQIGLGDTLVSHPPWHLRRSRRVVSGGGHWLVDTDLRFELAMAAAPSPWPFPDGNEDRRTDRDSGEKEAHRQEEGGTQEDQGVGAQDRQRDEGAG